MSKSTATVCLPFLLFMITTVINSVNSSGAYNVKFITYRNVEGLRLDNTTCDKKKSGEERDHDTSPNTCDFFLNATFWNGNQSSGPKKSRYSSNNIITFPAAYYDEDNTTSNPISINISSWKGKLNYQVDVMEEDTYTYRGKSVPIYELIETFAGNVPVPKPKEWVTVRRNRTGHPNIYLQFQVMVECFSSANTTANDNSSCFEINSQVSTTPPSTSSAEKNATTTMTTKKARTINTESPSTTSTYAEEVERKDTPIDKQKLVTTILWVVLGVAIVVIIVTLIIAYCCGLCKCGRHRKPETAAGESAHYSAVPIPFIDRPNQQTGTEIPDNPDDHIYAETTKRPKQTEDTVYFELEETAQPPRDQKRPDVVAET